MTTISSKPASGMRDFLATDVLRRRYVVDRIVRAYRQHGFTPLETPAIERLDVLTAKYGAEGDQLMFKLLVRADKLGRARLDDPSTLSDLALHYDLTVPMARVYAQHRNELPRYYKRYQIQPVWRADRPQKGRFREFYQCDVDYVGTSSMIAEVEVLSAMFAALRELSFGGVTARLNDRRLLFATLDAAGVARERHGAALTELDRLDKSSASEVRAALAAQAGLSGGEIASLAELIPGLGDESAAVPAREALRRLLGGLERAGADRSAGVELERLFSLVEPALGPGITLQYDPTLVRGLSYYTGTIMEFGAEGLRGSIAGGGRYDGLVGMFLNEDVPAVGGSLGLERILVIMQERGMFPDLALHHDVLVARMDDEAVPEGLSLCALLRGAGYSAVMFPEARKIAQQFRYAEEIGARWVAIVGTREAREGVVTMKHLASGEQTTVSREELLTWMGGLPST